MVHETDLSSTFVPGDAARGITHTARDVSKSLKWAHRALWFDVVLYIVFLVTFLLSALTPFVQVAWDGHQLINVFTKYASNTEWPDPSNTFKDIHSVADFWSWWDGPFRSILLGLSNYSPDDGPPERPDHVQGLILNNVVVGTVRLRQQRVKPSCAHIKHNVLDIPLEDTLCYLDSLKYQTTTDWSWPIFTITAADDYADEQSRGVNLDAVDPQSANLASLAIDNASEQEDDEAQEAFVASLDEEEEDNDGGESSTEARRGQLRGATSDSDEVQSTAEDDPEDEPPADVVGDSRRLLAGSLTWGSVRGAPMRVRGAVGTVPARGTQPVHRVPVTGLGRVLQQQQEEEVDVGQAPAQDQGPSAAEALPVDVNGTCLTYARDTYWGKRNAGRTCSDVTQHKTWVSKVTPAFQYRPHRALSSSTYASATTLRFYHGGGYAHDFDIKDRENFENITQLLQNHAWIDGATRVVLVEIVLYNPPTDLVATTFFMAEIHGSGYVVPRVGYEAFKLNSYRGTFLGHGRIAVDAFFVMLCVVIFFTDLVSVLRHSHTMERMHWWANPFFWMSIIMFSMTAVIIGLRIDSAIQLSKFNPADVIAGSDPFGSDFAKLHGPAARIRIERSFTAILSFCVWLRVFKYTRSVPVFGTIGRTMTRAFPAIMTYIGMSTIIFFGFAQSFFLGFYTSNEGFQTLQESLMSMVRFTSGDVDYQALQQTNTVLAPILYTMALFVLAFVWTSLLLAIVLNAYYVEISDEAQFEFDSIFQDFGLRNNPLILRHPEYDEDAIERDLTPEKYNRFIVNTLQRFDQSKLDVMPMSDFLDQARIDSDTVALGETTAIHRAPQTPAGHKASEGGGASPSLSLPGSEFVDHGSGVLQAGMDRVHTDSHRILVRFGYLKGVRAPLDIQALYFPIEMDEHRCRAWWQAHKHHLRVGEKVVRVVAHRIKQPLKGVNKLLEKHTSMASRASHAEGGAASANSSMRCAGGLRSGLNSFLSIGSSRGGSIRRRDTPSDMANDAELLATCSVTAEEGAALNAGGSPAAGQRRHPVRATGPVPPGGPAEVRDEDGEPVGGSSTPDRVVPGLLGLRPGGQHLPQQPPRNAYSDMRTIPLHSVDSGAMEVIPEVSELSTGTTSMFSPSAVVAGASSPQPFGQGSKLRPPWMAREPGGATPSGFAALEGKSSGPSAVPQGDGFELRPRRGLARDMNGEGYQPDDDTIEF